MRSLIPSRILLAERLTVFLKAMGMGTADLIPGVSGGTIAFITGIYERFIGALSRIDHRAVRYLFRGELKAVTQRVDLWFLLTILAGILTAVLILARLIDFLLTYYPVYIWSFFFGLILASIVMVSLRVNEWRPLLMIFLGIGILVAWSITQSNIIQTPDTWPYIFGSGFISITAMILPGISGSYILVILDKYDFFIGVMSSISEAIQAGVISLMNMNWAGIRTAFLESRIEELLIFYCGTLAGIITFAKVLNWLLYKFYDHAIALLTGFMAGSLFSVWPWRRTIETYTNRHGEEKPLIEENILPAFNTPETWLALLIMSLGAGLIILIHKLGQEKKQTHEG